MTKQEFITRITDSHDTISKKEVTSIVESVFQTMTDALKAGEKVSYPGFGTFNVKDRSARKGRNPQTGAEIQIPASKTVKFKMSATLKTTL